MTMMFHAPTAASAQAIPGLMPGLDRLELSANEAAFVAQRSQHVVRHAAPLGQIDQRYSERGRPIYGWLELRYLVLNGHINGSITPPAQRKLYEALRDLPDGADTVQFGSGFSIALAETDQALRERLVRMAAVKAAVRVNGAKQPMLRGAELPVHLVADRAKDEAALLAEFPELTPALIAIAVDYARLCPTKIPLRN